MIKIGLIGHDSRNDNLGVGALTVANIAAIRRVASNIGQNVEILVLIGASDRISCVSGADLSERVVRPMRKPWEVLKALRECDLVVDIAGGDSFTDIYGAKRIYQILLPQYLAHLSGRPLVMSPQTIGPFKSKFWRTLAAGSIKRAAVVATRDAKSTAFITEMGLNREVIEACDVAMRLPYDKSGARKPGPTRVGLNVSGLLMAGGYSGKNMFGLKSDYPTLIHKLMGHFSNQVPDCEVHLVGHVIPQTRGGVEDDHQTSLTLAKEFPKAIVAPAFTTPSEAKSYIASLDFFMGARMHACIAAFSSGVAVVPMAYSRKFDGLFGTLGYPYTVDCTSESSDIILEKIIDAYANRTDLGQTAQEALGRGLKRLERYDDALSAILAKRG